MMNTMSKRLAALLLALLLALTLAACGEKDPGTEPSDEEQGEKTSAYAVICNGTELRLGADASGALKKLGEASSTQEVQDCGAGNSRVFYRYPSFILYTMKNADGKEVIDQIELNDDLVETAEGIAIGDTEAELRDAYGTPSSEKNGLLTFSKGSYRLIAQVENGTVTELGLLRVTQ